MRFLLPSRRQSTERVIRSLIERTGAPADEVRVLFAREFARLELGAVVRGYLSVLTAANVRAMLRGSALWACESSMQDGSAITLQFAQLAAWEGEGGRPDPRGPRDTGQHP